MKKALCLLSLLVLSSSFAQAGVQPNGPELHASTCADDCHMWAPSVAGATAGTFAVVWEGTSTADPRGIFARFYTKNGAPRGREVLVNKEKEPAQYDASVAVDAQGNYIVAWSQIGSDRNSDVLVQRFRSTGAPLGAALRVNVDDPAAPPDDALPVVASAPNGFVVAWTRIAPPTPGTEEPRPEIMVRRFDKNAAPLGAPVRLNTGKARGQKPDVCMSKAGQAVVAWSTVDDYYPFEPSKYGVALRRVKATGAPDGAQVVVAPPTADVVDVAASCASDGSHVIVWRSNLAPSTDGSDLLGLRFTAKGRRTGNVFRINTGTLGEQYMPAASHDAAGNFVVVWVSRDGSDQNIIGRRFRSTGVADGNDFVVYQQEELSLPPTEPDVAHVGAAGEFVAVWQLGSEGVSGRRFKITNSRR